MKSKLKVKSLEGSVPVMGQEWDVTLRPSPHGDGSVVLHMTACAASVEDADVILTALGGLAAPQQAGAGARAPAPAPAAKPVEPAKGQAPPARGKAEEKSPAAAGRVGKPAEPPKGKAEEKPPAPRAGGGRAASPPLDMPGDDGDDDDEEEESATGGADGEDEDGGSDGAEEEEDETSLLPVPERLLQPAAKMRDVVAYLRERGYTTKKQLLVGCAALKDHVPILARVEDLDDRLTRTLQVLGYDKG